MAEHSEPGVAAILGLLQGATEFLPISSSGHLYAFAMFFRVPEMSLALAIAVHLATLLATVVMFRKDLADLVLGCARAASAPRRLLDTTEGKLAAALVASSASTAAAGLLLRDAVEIWAEIPWFVGLCFLGSAAAVSSTRGRQGAIEVPSIGLGLVIGAAQGLAVLPGLSRSGVTIACAMALGMNAPAAFRFSFLMSIPAIMGATLLELGKSGSLGQLGGTVWIAASVAFLTGYAALRWLKEVVSRGHLWWFACYLVPLGASLVLLDLTGHLDK